MKRILLLGDSIRMNYGPAVFRALNGEALVTAPEENCRFAKYTLMELKNWLSVLGTPDIVHWNNGIWDLNLIDGEVLTPLRSYLDDMMRILHQLQKTGAEIIFATTTPAKPENPDLSNADVAIYNTEAVKLMQAEGIEIDDLYSLVFAHLDEYVCDDLIHLSHEGIRAVGAQVTEVLRRHL